MGANMRMMLFMHMSLTAKYARVVAPILTVIFNKSLHFAEVPEDWKKANIAPRKVNVIMQKTIVPSHSPALHQR